MVDSRVCVIGAGAAGLTTIKQLKDQGVTDIDCFEKEDEVGGIFLHGTYKNGVYDNCVLTISNYLMAFSDMPPTGHRYHWHHSEYRDYLCEYAQRYDLRRHVSFGTSVLKVEGEPRRWRVTIQARDGRVIDKGIYDAVVICSGAHQAVNKPSIPGMDTFNGRIVHSSEYKNNAEFAGKDCVCVGLGESGADIVREISDVASSTLLALRSYPYLIPRLIRPFHNNDLGCSSDAYTSHLRHDLLNVPLCHYRTFMHILNRVMCTLAAILFWLFPVLGVDRGKRPATDAFHQDVSAGYLDKETPHSRLAAKLIYQFCDLSGQAAKGQKFACKNVMFVHNMVQGKIAYNVGGVRSVEPDGVVLNDGTRHKCNVLVLCTGYKDVFPFLSGTISPHSTTPLCVPEGNVRRLFKHVFHPEIGASMAWIGFVRPSTGGIPACAEMAARYFALVHVGQRTLPRNIAALTTEDYELDTAFYRLSAEVKTLVGYKDWMDSMAQLIGCEVRLWKYLMYPKLFVRLCIGSLLPSQYRLAGPCALPELSKATILAVPVAPTPRQSLGEACRSWLRHLDPRRARLSSEGCHAGGACRAGRAR